MRVGVQPAERLGGAAHWEAYWFGLQVPSRTDLALSPDGTYLVFNGVQDGKSQLHIRRMDESGASPIPATERGIGPFFSPDGQWLGFWTSQDIRPGAMGELKKVSLSGGLPVTLCETLRVVGASWGPEDAIAFARLKGGLWRVSTEGGHPRS